MLKLNFVNVKVDYETWMRKHGSHAAGKKREKRFIEVLLFGTFSLCNIYLKMAKLAKVYPIQISKSSSKSCKIPQDLVCGKIFKDFGQIFSRSGKIWYQIHTKQDPSRSQLDSKSYKIFCFCNILDQSLVGFWICTEISEC